MPFYADHSSFRSRATKLHDRASHVKHNKNVEVYAGMRESQENFMPYVISFKFRVNLPSRYVKYDQRGRNRRSKDVPGESKYRNKKLYTYISCMVTLASYFAPFLTVYESFRHIVANITK